MKKKIIVFLSVLCLAAMLVAPCFATSATTGNLSSDLTAAFTTGFQQIQANVLQILVVIVPIALSIVAVMWVSRKAVRWFKNMSGEGR